MKIFSRLLVLGSVLLAPALFAADAFEGKVSLALTTGKGRTQNINYSMKGSSMRIDMEAGKGESFGSIMNMEKHEMLVIMNAQKMYMTMPLQAAEAKIRESVDQHTANAEKTGKTDTILGYKCEQWLFHDKDRTSEAWVAEGLGTFMGLGGGGPMGGGRKPSAWEAGLKGHGGFPLRVIERDGSGKEVSRMEATKIEPGPLPASLFEPPAGFQKFEMPNLGGLFKQG